MQWQRRHCHKCRGWYLSAAQGKQPSLCANCNPISQKSFGRDVAMALWRYLARLHTAAASISNAGDPRSISTSIAKE